MKFFSNKKANKFRQKAGFMLGVIMLLETIYPSSMWALTSGPSSPEFSSFEPVTTTSMVDEFSGDFNYNIPVINIPGASGGGYAMSLSYHSGETVESEASWVGYGWTLNPGSINRGKRGFADDTKNTYTYYNDVPRNWTVSTGASLGNLELFSFGVPVSVSASIRYNNYRGFGYTAGAGLSFRQGLVSLGYSMSDGTGSFSAQVNPAALLSQSKKKKKECDAKTKAKYNEFKTEADKNKYRADQKKSPKEQLKSKAMEGIRSIGSLGSAYGMHSLGDQQHPTTITPYEGFSFNTNFSIQLNPSPLEVGPQIGFFGNFNYQKNKADLQRTGYGYLYSSEAYMDGNGVMDYLLEKEATFNKRDRYMSIPFSNADMYSVSGEGMGGGFRLHSKNAGYFRPNTVESKTYIAQLAGDVSLGLEYGGGVSVGLGQQTLTSGEYWGNATTFTSNYRFPNASADNEPFFFRFNNDLGGDVVFDSNNNAVKADITVDSWTPGFKGAHPDMNVNTVLPKLQSTIALDNGSMSRSGRSSYIGYHTNDEINYTVNNKRVNAYEKSAAINSIAYRSHGEQIGEIATVNEEGNTYVYGLPVYVEKETSMQYDLGGVSASNIHNKFIAYKDINGENKMKVGQVDEGRYVSSYLLTQITSPDYVDRMLDGPSSDDFGGYTQFLYEKHHDATNGSGYHYRIPYTGLNYANNELTDPSDDMGSYSSGNKDVDYLTTVETKTHIAKFITSDREDGMEAAGDATAANSQTAKGSKKLKKLDAIELYVKDDNGFPGKLIKTVKFKYDYSLCSQTPNNVNGGGKLTLKEVWFEYDGVVTAKISPYKFQYNYPTSAAKPYPTKYATFQAEYANLNENPNYNPFALDAWGNYQDATRGGNRFDKMKAGVSQIIPSATDPYAPPLDFDPAAWQLKVIQLPSGGEIHVQYEQDDYLYVQDKRAEALVSLMGGSSLSEQGSPTDYKINVADIGVSTPQEKQELVNLINQRYNNDKIFFKFLYALVGTNPDLGKCSSDYIDGYVNFDKADIDSNGDVYIRLDPNGGSYSLPRDVCLDLVKKQKGGKLNPTGNCDASASGVDDGLSVKAVVMQLLSKIGTSFFAQGTSCLEVKPDLSYFKIPVLKAKKGGGLRVKRILMYDANGIDTDVESLYGTEYFYQTEEGKSSGVVTNEPASIRDENALITFLPKRIEQSFAQKVIGGTDREQFEGPIGESLLPAPSVGYGRIVAKNIHSGKTNTGFVVSEFYTVKDYPFDMSYNGTEAISSTDVSEEKDWMNLPAIVFNYGVSNVFATQGYRFIMNSMHGQPKSVSTYAGDFAGGAAGTGPLKYFAQSSSTEYQYFQPGEGVYVQKPDGSPPVLSYPGKEMEMTFEMKSIEDVTEDASIEVDFGVGIAGVIPLPQASLSPLVNYTESKLRTHVTSKVIRYPVIQKSVISTQDGIVHKTENLVFSSYTGKPVKTKTTDGYAGLNLPSDNNHDGTYTSYSTPAYSQYAEMGQKAINENFTLIPAPNITITSSLIAGHYFLNFAASSGTVCDAMKGLVKGDLVLINGNYFHIDETVGSAVEILPAALLNQTVSLPNGTNILNIKVVRSGRTNQLNTMAGSYTTYGAYQAPVVTPIPASILGPRQAFAAGLSSAIASHASNYVYNGTAQILDADGNCIPLQDRTINLTYNGNDVTVSVLTQGGSTVLCTPDDHQLVADLNLWLNTSWDLQVQTLSSFDQNEFNRCSIPYFISYIGDPNLINEIHQHTGETNILNSLYSIIGFSQPQTGQSILSFSNTNSYQMDKINHVARKWGNQVNIGSNFLYVTGVQIQNNGSCPPYQGWPSATFVCTEGSVPCGVTFNASQNPDLNNADLFTFINTKTPFTTHFGKFHMDTQGWLWYERLATTYCGFGRRDQIIRLKEPTVVPPSYCNMTLPTPGSFSVNTSTGQLEYFKTDNPCHPYPVECIKFCPDVQEIKGIPNVVASGATTFDCNWQYDLNLYAIPGLIAGNSYETGVKGKWRPKSNFVYNETIVGGSKTTTGERNYKAAGVYMMEEFNWKSPSANNPDKWVKATTVTKYSPNGEALEEVDALGIYSTAKFGYKGTVPYLVAQNADMGSVQFESFEKLYGNQVEDGVFIATSRRKQTTAHAGKWSYHLQSSNYNGTLAFKPMTLTQQLFDKGLSIKVWVKDASHSLSPLKGTINTTPITFAKIAQTGEWTLMEAKVTNWTGIALNSVFTPFVQSNVTVSNNLYIDDVRIQPLNAQMNAYVYDATTLRLLTSFDDQHFGLYYQYNQEGKLVRKMIETEKGLKTVTETQYNTPTEARP
ncbi:MAG: hypothetical protein Q8M29_14445 [Bacteroidota bacterium]|nr:hypothetical protein [Bacteroidota bacterium]